MITYRCRACNSAFTVNLGLLQERNFFAGMLLDQSLPVSSLYKCNDCLLIARHPILLTSQYNDLYEQATSKVWSSSNAALRYDQVAVKNIILNRKKSDLRVLDVGCYTAELLSSLPENYVKYGIEMSQEAASLALRKGTKILGNDLYNIDTIEKFDLILAVDVIEHTHNPEHFIKKLSSLLLPNGEIVISTGNTDNWLWKLLKNRFWYCKFPENISFIGEKWLTLFCKKNNFIVVDIQYFSYVPSKPLNFFKNFSKLFFSLIHMNPERLSNTTKDHFCFVIRKMS